MPYNELLHTRTSICLHIRSDEAQRCAAQLKNASKQFSDNLNTDQTKERHVMFMVDLMQSLPLLLMMPKTTWFSQGHPI